MKYHLMLEFTTEIMWDGRNIVCFKGEALIAQIFPETKIEFPVFFSAKKMLISTPQ